MMNTKKTATRNPMFMVLKRRKEVSDTISRRAARPVIRIDENITSSSISIP
jgi:hypothetical protein